MRHVWILVLVMAIACKNKSKDEELKARGIQRIKIGNVFLEARLMPGYGQFSSLKNTAIDTHSALVYFDVSIERSDKTNPSKEKLLYLNFDMQKDFSLKAGDWKLVPIFCQRIENGRSECYEYIVAFDKSISSSKTYSLLYVDTIFGIGTVEFVYDPSEIKKLTT